MGLEQLVTPEEKIPLVRDITSQSYFPIERTPIRQPFSGKAPSFIELPNGKKIRTFSDAQVYFATQQVIAQRIHSEIDRQIEDKKHFPAIITRDCYKKILSYAQVVAQEFDSAQEIYMHLLRERKSPQNLITDVIAAHKQEVTPSSCRVTGAIDDSLFRKRNKKVYAGWCHSHGVFQNFHSPTDDRNMYKLLERAYAPKKRITIAGLEQIKVEVSYMPSIVVNIKGDMPYCVMGFRYKDYFTQKHTSRLIEKDLRVVNINYFSKPYTSQEIREEISRKITLEGTHV